MLNNNIVFLFCKVFFNMPNIDDKLNDNKFVIKLLKDLGFTRISEKESFGFNLFR